MKSSPYILYLSILLFVFSCDEEPQLDCAGIEGGSASLDDCGLCTGGTTDFVANYKKDCAGTCDGTAIEDECGVCEGDNTSCLDCEGVINGQSFIGCTGNCDNSTFDECGVCNGADITYDGYCQDDIDVLNQFITNSLEAGGLNIPLDDWNQDGEVTWDELCQQTWLQGRLTSFSVFTTIVHPNNHCNLAGNIPENIGNWTELAYLDLGYHPDPDNTSGLLTGTIPNGIANLTKLESLYLYNNSFS